ncbi:hypothetical protein JD292_11005 [Leucobacter sp. CSA2]|uniref:Uncharacterized protein n=1 Tax=Leucobacter edaphi TaxID=2796472 RepID=A0A934UXC3_9MICO|nr:hypothetical protein [Leucobacter edaphi]MBK0422599.1 hypothetical protein [Leucobacter edaphi]
MAKKPGAIRQPSLEERAAERTRIKIELFRVALPVLWFGMIAAISFIEAPLKFQAPGITIPLGLGIGRLVFAALNIAEGAILLAFTILSFWPTIARVAGKRVLIWFGLVAVYASKIVFVRPPLNARTDQVLQGADPGQSPWHYVYIACDVITMILLVVAATAAARALIPPKPRA